MNELIVYETTLERFFADARKAAAAIDRGDRVASPARLAFEGPETFFKVLTPNRWALLRRLKATGPSSIRALAAALGRDYRGVHADVTALLPIDLVMRDAAGKISVPWSKITAELVFDDAA